MLCDDDFIMTAETRFDDALSILASKANIGVVGGRLQDIHQVGDVFHSQKRFWELYLNLDRDRQHLVSVPINYLAPEPHYCNRIKYFMCDAVMNFAIFRKAIFDGAAGWDPMFKSNGEHEDFYLNLKYNTDYDVAYVPTMMAEHHHPPSHGYAKLRHRSDGWRRFMAKWNINQHFEMGLGLRTVTEPSKLHKPPLEHKNFFVNAELDANTDWPSEGRFGVSNTTGQFFSRSQYRDHLEQKKKASVYARLELGADGKIGFQGGRWAAPQKDPAPPFYMDSPCLEACKPEFRIKAETDASADFFGYLRLSNASHGSDKFADLRLVLSWRKGKDYIRFREPINIYGHSIRANQWTAIPMRPPPVNGLLTYELTLETEDVSQFIDGDVVVQSNCVTRGKQVNGWATGRV